MKSNTKELRQAIRDIMQPYCNSYHRKTNKPDNYPYAVFTIRELSREDGRSQNTLEINVMSMDPAEADNIADAIQDALDHCSFENEYVSFYCYRGQRQFIEEEDKSINRIRLTLELYVYSTEE